MISRRQEAVRRVPQQPDRSGDSRSVALVLAARVTDSRCVGCRFQSAPGSGRHGDVEPLRRRCRDNDFVVRWWSGDASRGGDGRAHGRSSHANSAHGERRPPADADGSRFVTRASRGDVRCRRDRAGGPAGAPAAVMRDGATWFTEPAPQTTGLSFQLISADGRETTRIVVPPIAPGFEPRRLKGLADGNAPPRSCPGWRLTRPFGGAS